MHTLLLLAISHALRGKTHYFNRLLGNGTTDSTNRPVMVASNVVAVAGGSDHSLFVTLEGTLWGMGYNNYGQLGNGTPSSPNGPRVVASNVVAAAACEYHSLVLPADGTLRATGCNVYGQLGDGTTNNTSSPILVNGGGLLTASLAREPMASHSLAIAGAMPVVDALTNQTVNPGEPASFTASVSGGDGPFTYQWHLNGTNLVAATNDSYNITSTALTDAGDYSVTVASPYGSATSSNATLTVVDTIPPQIICPTNLTLVTTNPAGRAVSFAPTATDNCDPSPAVICTPPSGSVFPIGTNTVECVATDAAGNSNSCQFQIVVVLNHNPVAHDIPLAGVMNQLAHIPLSEILTHVSDADGDPLSVTGVSTPSTNGVSVGWDGAVISYLPATGYTGADLFTYRGEDNRGGQSEGRVLVTVTDGGSHYNRLSPGMGAGGFALGQTGVPGRLYYFQRSTNLRSWDTIAERMADSLGHVQFTDTTPPRGGGYYRTVSTP